MTELPAALLNGVGVVGVVLLVFWLLSTARLVTKGEMTRTTALYTLRIADLEHERDEYKEAARISAEQVSAMIPAQQTIIHLLESLDKERP